MRMSSVSETEMVLGKIIHRGAAAGFRSAMSKWYALTFPLQVPRCVAAISGAAGFGGTGGGRRRAHPAMGSNVAPSAAQKLRRRIDVIP
jgi:hypothetical protein